MWLFKVAKTSKYAARLLPQRLELSPKTLLDHKASYFLVQIRCVCTYATAAAKGRWRGAHINLANLQLEMSTAVATRSSKFSQDFIVDFQV